MEEQTTIYLSKNAYFNELDFLINYFQQNKINSVDVLFGYAWGNEFGKLTRFIKTPK